VKKYFFVPVLAALMAGSVQAAPAASTGTGATKSGSVASAQARRGLSDPQIERNIRARLARSKISLKDKFTVSVQDGVATLEGKTSVIQHKGVATRLAKMGGAIAVQNHIRISEEARAKAAARLAKYRMGMTGDGTPQRATVIQAKK
jgi:osmotically-inducible protein OsmY